MALEFEVTTFIPRSPREVYNAWLDSKQHTKMTGAKAKVSNKVGGEFEAWDGYISGRNLELEPGKRIVQAWRTVEFDESEEDSRIEVVFEPVEGGTKLILRHTRLPAHGEIYKQGWEDNYFTPMKAYFK